MNHQSTRCFVTINVTLINGKSTIKTLCSATTEDRISASIQNVFKRLASVAHPLFQRSEFNYSLVGDLEPTGWFDDSTWGDVLSRNEDDQYYLTISKLPPGGSSHFL